MPYGQRGSFFFFTTSSLPPTAVPVPDAVPDAAPDVPDAVPDVPDDTGVGDILSEVPVSLGREGDFLFLAAGLCICTDKYNQRM